MHKYYVKNYQRFICDFLFWLTLSLTLQAFFKGKTCCSCVPCVPISPTGHGQSHVGCSGSFQAQGWAPIPCQNPVFVHLSPAQSNLSCCCARWALDLTHGLISQLELGPVASPRPFLVIWAPSWSQAPPQTCFVHHSLCVTLLGSFSFRQQLSPAAPWQPIPQSFLAPR